MSQELSPARYGNGYHYHVEIPGAEEPHILADDRELEDIYAEASGGDGILRFRGILTDAALPDGKVVQVLVGKGFVHAGAESGIVVRLNDQFTGPPTENDGQEDDEQDAPPTKPRASSPFPSLRGR
jgi:hypothetical protein